MESQQIKVLNPITDAVLVTMATFWYSMTCGLATPDLVDNH